MNMSKSVYDKTLLNHVLKQMLLIRVFEERCAQLYGLRKIGGFCHLYNGQEAVAMGTIAATDQSKDYMLTSYRDHGHALGLGMDPKSVMAELFGKETGCSKGKGGSMHLFDVTRNFFGGNGIVGAQIPVAAGTAFKQRYLNEDGVTLCFFGDGAIHQGAFHESINLAKIWELPVLFIVENNEYGMGTAVNRVSSITEYEKRASAYGLPGYLVNGMDFFDVYEKTKKAVDRARKKHEACIMHVKTYRYRGHSMSDPAKYRSKEELEEYKKKDPIQTLLRYMINENMISEKAFQTLEGELKQQVEEAVQFAEESNEPPLSVLHEDVLAE